MNTKRKPLRERFMRYVEVSPDGCWLWTGSCVPSGYGSFQTGRRTLRGHWAPTPAHRVSYELFVGEIPEGLQLDHLCRVRSCVNPEHLEPVTSRENTRRGKALITSCPQGHEYDEKNTHYTQAGHRQCRACALARYHAKKAAA